ncbi:MAG: hypothetical protein QOG28_4545, partial [Trebonia sp.]|nr:hypothetical protein [Trebonia sp.]
KEFRTAAAAMGEQGPRLEVEPRHETWWSEEVRQVLAAHDAALCWADRRGRPVTPLWRTATWGYLRFHEGTAQPRPSYGPQALRSWVARLSEAWPDEADVYVYFNNDQGGAAVINSARFASLAREAGRSVTRTPLHAHLVQPARGPGQHRATGRRTCRGRGRCARSCSAS